MWKNEANGCRIYLGIPPEKTRVVDSDFKPVEENSTRLAGGFFYGASRNGSIYIAPRPLLNHGIHRCEYTWLKCKYMN
jgi:hypothetical protein